MISCSNVTKDIGGQRVLDQVDLLVEPASCVGLVGPNGSGKTMLLRAVLGLVGIDDGLVEVAGERLPYGAETRRRIGAAIDTPAIYPWMTGRGMLKTCLEMSGRRDSGEVDEVLQRVGLANRSKSLTRSYSQGMRKRIAIAVALLGEPDILCLDEPTNALDVEGVEMVQREVLDAKRQGATIVLASHDVETIEALCDSVIRLQRGRVVDPESSALGSGGSSS